MNNRAQSRQIKNNLRTTQEQSRHIKTKQYKIIMKNIRTTQDNSRQIIIKQKTKTNKGGTNKTRKPKTTINTNNEDISTTQ